MGAHRLKAFTLFELMVGMAILSVLLPIGYFFVQKVYMFIEKSKSSAAVIQPFIDMRSLLEQDFFNATEMYRRTYGLECKMHNGTIVDYRIHKEGITRTLTQQQINLETNIQNFELYLNGQEALVGDPVNEVKLDVWVEDVYIPIWLHKQVDAQSVINQWKKKNGWF